MRDSPSEPANLHSVLVVEDEPLIRRNLRKKVAQAACGFAVTAEAIDGIDALTILKQSQPDLILVDIRMPRMDGLALLAEVRNQYPTVRAIVVSGYDDFTYAQRAIRHGVQDYLLKPVTVEALAAALSRVGTEIASERHDLDSFYRNLRNAPSSRQVAEDIASYIRNTYAQKLDVARMASELNINYASLGRIFKRHIGTSISEYALSRRVEAAKHILLENPDIDVKTVAARVGYDDQGYFCRVFRERVRVSPSAFRKLHVV